MTIVNYSMGRTCEFRSDSNLYVLQVHVDFGAILEKKREDEKVHPFLMGLDETIYGTVRSNLLAQDLLPTLNRVYSKLVQDKRVKMMARGIDKHRKAMTFIEQTHFLTEVIMKERIKYDVLLLQPHKA